MKNKKFLKILLIIFITIIVILLAHFIRNATIIQSLNKKTKQYINSNNYHEIWSTYNKEQITVFDVYYKDGKYKQIFTNYDYDLFMSNNENPYKTITYRDGNGKETTYYYNNKISYSNDYTIESSKISPENMSHITMIAETPLNFIQTCFNSIIIPSCCNGIDTYRMSFISNNNIIYFSKETGLTVREGNGFTSGINDENQTYTDCISDITYEFNKVTDKDMTIPNVEEFTVKEF